MPLDEVTIRGTREGPLDLGPQYPGTRTLPPNREPGPTSDNRPIDRPPPPPPPDAPPPPGSTTDPETGLPEVIIQSSVPRPWWQLGGLFGALPAPAPKPSRRAPRRSRPKPKPRRTPRRTPRVPGRALPGGPNLFPFRFGGALSGLALLGSIAYRELVRISDQRIRELIGGDGSGGGDSGNFDFPIELAPFNPPDRRVPVPDFEPEQLPEVTISAPRPGSRSIPDFPADPILFPFAVPGPFAAPSPSPGVDPFAPPSPSPGVDPFAPPSPFAPPVPSPLPRAEPRPAAPPRAEPNPFGNPFAPPNLTPLNPPALESPPQPNQAGCNCPKPEKDKKKRSKKKPRNECYRGTYYENSKSITKYRKEKIPCQRSKPRRASPQAR